jgi:hypothetical protein
MILCAEFTVKPRRLLLAVLLILLLANCSGIGAGVAEAALEKTENEDARQCQVWGKSFAGIDVGLNKSQCKSKVLFVYGVGEHQPGYTQFLKKMTKELNLNIRADGQKNITITAPLLPGKELGNLRVSRL